jgi:three-Cys-motif partner protein
MGQRFGGPWTQEKLERLAGYLRAYRTIFTANERASFFTTWYVDAFAGSGTREQILSESARGDAEEAVELLKGSAHVALETASPFDRYVFVEKDAAHAANLTGLRDQYPSLAERMTIVHAEANQFLQSWCKEIDWQRNRAVAFLDPYGMQVDWATIEAIAATQAIDLWILFPLGQGVNRLLIRDRPPEGPWADRLTRFFGTPEWRERFYRPAAQGSLFGAGPAFEKEADFESIGAYFLERLRSVFADVAQHTLAMRNSRGVPMFLLCFAAANPKGAPIAVRIANHLLRD